MQKLISNPTPKYTSVPHGVSIDQINTPYSHSNPIHGNKANGYQANCYQGYRGYEQGVSVSGVVFFLLALGVFVKLAIAIIPAQIGDYQFTKLVAQELRHANDKGLSATEFMTSLNKQLTINASYDTNPAEMLTITNKNSGRLAVHKNYAVTNNFFGNVDIVNKFEGDIVTADAND